MSRPKFLNCVMTSNVISRIKQEQEYYDKDPDRYERQQHEAQEQYRMEQEEMVHQMRLEQQREAERQYYEEQQEELPF